MRDEIKASLATAYDAKLVAKLLDAYEEAKRNFYLGGHRLEAVEGGRFCEAAYRMLEQEVDANAKFTPLEKQLDTEAIARRLANAPPADHDDSIRLHIPRSLRVVYDIRNKRGTAHLADGIDPNVQDSTLVASVLDWIVAEFVRLHHDVSADEAQTIVENLVERKAPVIEAFDGFLKVLDPDLTAGEHCLVLLYQCGADGATYDQLYDWARPQMRTNLRRTLDRLVNDRARVHEADRVFCITRAGINHVEDAHLIDG